MSNGKAIGGLVAIALVLGGGLVAGDRYAEGRAADYARGVVADRIGASGSTNVEVHGFPFLTQVLGGSLQEVTATADGGTLNGVALTDIAVDARDVKVEVFGCSGRPQSAGQARVGATLPVATLQSVVRERTKLAVTLTVEGSALRASGSVLGLILKASLVPKVEGGKLLVDVQGMTLADRAISVESLPSSLRGTLNGIEVPFDSLPSGMTLTAAQVVPTGVRVTASGTNVTVPAQ